MTEVETPAIWTLDELIAHARSHPDDRELRNAVVREGRLAVDDAHRQELTERATPREPATAKDVHGMSGEAFEQMRRTQRRGGFQW